MYTIKKHLSEPWFSFVRDKVKTHEGRINIGFWKNLQLGDKFIFWNEENEFEVEIAEKLIFSSFKEAINKIGLENVLPNYTNIDIAIEEVYYKYFTKDDEQTYGIVMLKFNIL